MALRNQPYYQIGDQIRCTEELSFFFFIILEILWSKRGNTRILCMFDKIWMMLVYLTLFFSAVLNSIGMKFFCMFTTFAADFVFSCSSPSKNCSRRSSVDLRGAISAPATVYRTVKWSKPYHHPDRCRSLILLLVSKRRINAMHLCTAFRTDLIRKQVLSGSSHTIKYSFYLDLFRSKDRRTIIDWFRSI